MTDVVRNSILCMEMLRIVVMLMSERRKDSLVEEAAVVAAAPDYVSRSSRVT